MLLMTAWLIHSDMMWLGCHDQGRAKKFDQPENSIFFSGAGMKSSGVEKNVQIWDWPEKLSDGVFWG